MESFITNILNTILQVSPIQQGISKFLNTKHLKRVFMRAVEESGHKDILPNNWNTLDISECWNLLSTHRDIKNAIAEKLLKDPTLHLQFVALQIDANKKDQNVSPLLDLDERTRINNENDFFRMYPNSSFCVEDLFIEPNYKVYRLINGESKLASINTVNIEDTCKKIMNEQKILLIMGPYGTGKTFIICIWIRISFVKSRIKNFCLTNIELLSSKNYLQLLEVRLIPILSELCQIQIFTIKCGKRQVGFLR